MNQRDQNYEVHMAHCYQGEEDSHSCKYGDANCPAKVKAVPDGEVPTKEWAIWAWQAFRDGRLVEEN